MKKGILTGVVLAVSFLLLACTTTVVENDDEIPRIVISQGGDGKVSIAWESKPGVYYSVYYQKNPEDDWKVLRGANHLRGTGGIMTVEDRVDPYKPPRRYRLLPEKK